MSLLTELDAFFLEHRGCGELHAGVDGRVVWSTARAVRGSPRRADEGDALDVNG